LGAAIDYLDRVGMANITRYEHELLVMALTPFERVPGLHIIGTAAEKAGVLSFVLDGVPHRGNRRNLLNREGIAVRSGHHCAQPIHRRFGLERTVRASLALYNTCEDIDALVVALLRIQTAMLTNGSFSLATRSEGNGSRARGSGVKLDSAGSAPGAELRSGGATSTAPSTRRAQSVRLAAHQTTAKQPRLCATNTTFPERERTVRFTASTQSARWVLCQSF
jgi:hypothetical protein